MLQRSPLALLFFGGAACAGVVWVGDFETRDLSPWDPYIVNQQDWSFVGWRRSQT